MQRWILACGFAVLSTVALAQSHRLPPGHIDRYTGELILRAGVSAGMNYAAAYLLDEKRWFVYQVEAAISLDEVRTRGVIEYWHDGFRVTLPREGRALLFRRAETVVPHALRRLPFATTSYTAGYGIASIERRPPEVNPEGPVTTQDYCSPEFHSCGPYDQDPVGGSGGGSSCLPQGCSVNCGYGSCQANCNPGFTAVCSCNSTSSAVCSCIRC